jgi:rubrerythrin
MTMDAHEQVLEILRKAYQLEVDGYTFYAMTADRATKPLVRELFSKLAADEVEHQAFLREVSGHYGQKGAAAFDIAVSTPDLRAFTQAIFSDKLREEAQGAEFEAAVLSVGITLETNSITHYASAAQHADEEQVRSFYHFLADWERQHLQALQNAYAAMRADFWSRTPFRRS